MISKKNKDQAHLIGIIFDKAEYPYGDEGVRDMITDLMHYCKVQDISFEHELTTARLHFYEEDKVIK